MNDYKLAWSNHSDKELIILMCNFPSLTCPKFETSSLISVMSSMHMKGRSRTIGMSLEPEDCPNTGEIMWLYLYYTEAVNMLKVHERSSSIFPWGTIWFRKPRNLHGERLGVYSFTSTVHGRHQDITIWKSNEFIVLIQTLRRNSDQDRLRDIKAAILHFEN